MKKFAGVVLNSRLVENQNVSQTDQDIIQRLHELKHCVFQFMQDTDDVDKLREYAQIVETIEYKLQKHWGFKLDRNFHDWFDVPKCSCPKMDNRDAKGTLYRTISGGCKIHAIHGK
jgi:hypothetical protein